MKWIILAGLLGMIGPLAMLLRSQPKYLVHSCFFMGVLVFFLDPYFNISPVSWSWPDAVKGFEVSILDAISIAIILSTRSVRFPIGLKIGLGLYILALIISSFSADQFIPAAFYIWQFMRACVVCVAVARATAVSKDAPFALFAGLGLALVVEAMLATKQYLGGDPQPGGTLGHRNILGLTSHFVVMPAFAMLLAARRNALDAIVVFFGALSALVGGSRATIGLLAIGLIITTILSMRHKVTGRKSAMAGAAVIGLVLAVPAMMWAIDRRSETALASSDNERTAMKRAARMIIADHPMGLGANQYVVTANVGGYSDRAGVAWNFTSRSAPVHNSYYLITAELGFLGVVGLLATLLSMIGFGLSSIRKLIPDERSDLFIGCTAALILVTVHISFEWLFVTAVIHYLLAMNVGAMVGIAAALRKRAPSPVRRPVSTASPALASHPG